jgi:hypothetical protein
LPSEQETIQKYLEVLKNRISSYRTAFDQAQFENRAVLTDLALFCRMFTTTEEPGQKEDPRVLEGRRQVFLRIQEHLQFDHNQLYQLHPLRNMTPQVVTPGTLTTGISATAMNRASQSRGEMNG